MTLRPTLALILFAISATAIACGPHFPNAYLFWDDLYALQSAGPYDYYMGLESLLGESGAKAKPQDKPRWPSTEKAEAAEIRQAMIVDLDVEVKVVAPLIKEYRALREDIANKAYLPYISYWYDGPEPHYPLESHEAMVRRLPPEFRLYLQGAIAYRAHDAKTAIEHWEKLLTLPRKQRHYRTVWAWYMLGKAHLTQSDFKTSADCFVKARQAANQGYSDTLALALDSLGWEARARRFAGQPVAAVTLYADQFQRGDSDTAYFAADSINIVFSQLLTKGTPEQLHAICANDRTRLLLFNWLASGRFNLISYRISEQVLAAIRQAIPSTIKDPAAGALAAIAYNNGWFEEAQAWLAYTPDNSPQGKWVRAKFLFRQGKDKEATAILTAINQADAATLRTSGIQPEKIFIELGIAHANAGHYQDSLRAFLTAHAWVDAAYIAERVLTVHELITIVTEYEKTPLTTAVPPDDYSWQAEDVADALRHLLARRLIRDGDFKRAHQYLPERLQPQLKTYAEALTTGHDTTLDIHTRATALITAASTLRQFGMELQGTEIEPDWFLLDGNYSPSLGINRRLDSEAKPAEKVRVNRHAPPNQKRFHYRYQAADIAWEAAQLLPDEDILTARALYTGGSFLKKRDPDAADRFYKALVNRCSTLPIGLRAAQKRWFPNTFDNSPVD